MSVTPQTNTTLPELAAALAERDDFVICGHVSPDGDCIGSQLALMHALRSLGKRAVCLLAKDEPIDARLAFLPGADGLVPAALYDGPAATFVAVDVPMRDRMNSAAAHLLDACAFSATVDHHAYDERMTDLMGAERGAELATCCYTGLVTDTGRFQYQNTDAAALAAASAMVAAGADAAGVAREIFQSRSLPSVELEALAVERMRFGADGGWALSWVMRDDFDAVGAVKADAEPLIDALRSLRGVRVACMLRDQGDSVRGSFRAKDGTDVAALARTLGGGGHRAAAGFTVSGPMEAAVERIGALLDEALAGTPADAEGERGA